MQRQKELEATVNTLKEQIDRLKRDVSVLLDVECHPVFCTLSESAVILGSKQCSSFNFSILVERIQT